MEKQELKKGDKLRIVSTFSPIRAQRYHHFDIGEVVTVDYVTDRGGIMCFNEEGLRQLIRPWHVVPAEEVKA